MNKMRSFGIYAFRTPTNDHLNYGTKFRTLNNQGNMSAIMSMMRTSDTVATAGGCSYDEEHYMEWAPKIYNQRLTSRWEENFWLEETVTFWNNSAWDKLRIHYNSLAKNYSLFRDLFVPIKWTTGGVSMTDIKSYMEYLTETIFPGGVAIKNLALEERYGRSIIYAKKSWLQTFRKGRQMINYYSMAKKFHEVYGF